MKTSKILSLGATTLLLSALLAPGAVKVTVDHNDAENAKPEFKFKNVRSPSKTDAAAKAKITIVANEQDPMGGDVSKLTDGKLPTEMDQPEENFFFNQGADGGRIQMDFGKTIAVSQVNTYSWHPDTRGPQVYKLYASDGSGGDFKAKPEKGVDPTQAGWNLLATVDTRPKEGKGGGQYAVSVSSTDGGMIGKYRYLLFDCSQTESDDAFGNTFYSEIDVLDMFVTNSADGKCEITIDTNDAEDLKEWAETKLAPVLADWYPKLVAMLPSDGYIAPTKFSVNIGPRSGVAATGGTRVTANSAWLKRELNREAIGALLHEEVHVVQQYGGARRNNPNAKRAPGWLTEAIPDYIRWFKYEPDSHGADNVWIKKQRNFVPKYDTAYRPGANFLNFVSEKYDKDLVMKLNKAIREGKWTDDIWKDLTGKTTKELEDAWKEELKADGAIQ